MSRKAIGRLCLGTATFGLDYGIANPKGQLSQLDVNELLEYCSQCGIDTLDTAVSYGESERAIGEYMFSNPCRFKIVTKLPPRGSALGVSISTVEENVRRSVRRLEVRKLYGCLVHCFEDYCVDEELWPALEEVKNAGLVERIGFSLYTVDELKLLMDNGTHFDILQVPYSVFDTRFSYLFEDLKGRGVEIYVRSVFLQGLAFMNPLSLQGNLVKARPFVSALHELADEYTIPVCVLCLGFVLLNPWIDRIVLGVDGLSQLESNLEAFSYNEKLIELKERIRSLHIDDEEILLPYRWVTS
ncbi:aldo/keto reductase [Planctomycetota bacterium]